MCTIRQATKKDIPVLCRFKGGILRSGPHNPADADQLEKNFERYLNKHLSPGAFKAWIAETDKGQPMASIGLSYYQIPPTVKNPKGTCAYISCLYTVPAFRGKGIAGKCLQVVFDHLAKEGIGRATLYPSPEGKRFFAKMGFTSNVEMRRFVSGVL